MEPKIDPELVLRVRNQVADWNKELKDPWIPSPRAMSLVQTLRNSAPTMARLLEKAGILEAWAEILDDRVWTLQRELMKQGREAGEAMNQAMLELIPATSEAENEWMAAYTLHSV
ncbi:MAG: hypothetical protein H7A48_13855 [Akkermansiaceae bacterium]|nr:hypothetical protein [Akkermansiaceae bacterium]MCP5547357.1 hypothetical protein [Akkermansiaceae bacterium]